MAEYNPFHNGHKYQIDKFKKEKNISHLVIIMSGNFVQRGAPAIVDKFSRARCATRCGADLVMELPAYFATQGAEIFSSGAMKLIKSLDVCECMCFGSESGSVDILKKIADIIENRRFEYESLLKKNLSGDIPFAKSRELAICELMGDNTIGNIISSPNNILGIEYIREYINLGMDMDIYTIKRTSDYLDKNISYYSDIQSATSIRKAILDGVKKKFSEDKLYDALHNISKYVPMESLYEIDRALKNGARFMEENLFSDEISHISMLSPDSIIDCFEVGEGNENKIVKLSKESYNIDEMVEIISSKRISKSRARRMINNILLGVKKEDINVIKGIEKIPYARVLSFNDRGRDILRCLKNSEIEIVISPAKAIKSSSYKNDENFKMLFDFDLKTSSIYFRKYYSHNKSILRKGEVDFVEKISVIQG